MPGVAQARSSVLKITGGVSLSGTVAVSGAKNAALPMMAASILASEPVRLENVPRLADVHTLSLVLEELGMSVARTPDGALLLETVDATPIRARYGLVRRMRASFCVLGPLLARRQRAVVSLPGGCSIGDRPVDLHLAGLAALGANLRITRGYVVASARQLRGATIDLSGPQGPTVTGTANVLSAAVLARGKTTITGAAVEPEIVDLGNLLSAMGARIDGLGTPTVRVAGVERLSGAAYRVIPDRIEAATLLLAAAITGGSATVSGLAPEHLDQFLAKLRSSGAKLEVGPDRVTVSAAGRPRPTDITAAPYPGIPTDIQAQWMALLCLADGHSIVCDSVFPARFMHVAELNRLGASIRCYDGHAVVSGVRRLCGAGVRACDLRASAAVVLAGLAAEGQTVVHQIHHLDRGYQRLDQKLNRLGARIERVSEDRHSSPAVVR